MNGGVIKDNVYSGAVDALTSDPGDSPWTERANTGVTSCDNSYGPNKPNRLGVPTAATTEKDGTCR